MNVQERIQYIIDNAFGGVQVDFCRAVGMADTKIAKIKKGEVKFSIEVIDTICRAIPAINREFLETGEGYPGDISVALIKQRYDKAIREKDDEIDFLRKNMETQRKTIEALIARCQ